MKTKITFKLNGETITLETAGNAILLETLRDELGVKSPKCGCDRGDCGTCTVLINGRTVRSCLALTAEVDGAEIVTLEGLMKEGPTPLQETFISHNAFQCGFCAPGVILSTHELLQRNPHPTEHEMKEAIAGNLCRCTGYSPILDAITDFTKKGKE